MFGKIGKKRKITFWTRLGFGMGGMLNSGALTFTQLHGAVSVHRVRPVGR